jgi:Ca-activated chloride channel family protein
MSSLPHISFLWPELLWLQALLPLLVLFYAWLLRRRKQLNVRLPHLAVLKRALPGGGARSWRRHVPAVLLGLALACLLAAAARPMARVALWSQQRTIVLAMDVSGSMRATDVLPNRLIASQEAAKAFLAELPRSVRVAVVSFAGTAAVVQAPTLSRDDVVSAIDRFQLQRGTAIGSGIVLSLSTLFPDAGFDLSQITGQRSMPPDPREAPRASAPGFIPVPPGSYGSAAVILLTDGQRTTGPDVMETARLAAQRGVRVYTVGVGTKEGETIGFDGWSMRVRLDEDTLKHVAQATQGDYFYAGTAADLKKVYQALGTRLVMENKETEVSSLLAAAGAVLMLLGAGLSLAWFGRVLG